MRPDKDAWKQIAMIGAMVVLMIAAIIAVVFKDGNKPVIEIDSTELIYRASDDAQKLLAGVSAYDKEDGDVTASLLVESIVPIEDGMKAKVTYAARDSANNITKATRIVRYIADSVPLAAQQAETQAVSDEGITQTGSEEVQGGQVSANASIVAASSGPQQTQKKTEAQQTQKETKAQQTQKKTEEQHPTEAQSVTDEQQTQKQSAAAAPPKYPVITMKSSEATVSKGENLIISTYVDNISDDKDDRDKLFKRIQINGTYDVNTPGNYPFYVYCIDSDKNTSEMIPFVLHVR